jgi:hypothetical protein
MTWYTVMPEMDGVLRPDLGANYRRPTLGWARHLHRRLERKRAGRYGFRWVAIRSNHPDL